MRADAKNGFFDFSFASIQMNFDLFARLESLCAARNESQPICLNKRGDDSRATRQRRSKQLIANFANRNTDIIIVARRGYDFASQGCYFCGQLVGSSS